MLYVAVYLKFKNRQKEFIGLKFRTGLTVGSLDWERVWAGFLGPGNALDFDLGSGYMGLCKDKISSSCPPLSLTE